GGGGGGGGSVVFSNSSGALSAGHGSHNTISRRLSTRSSRYQSVEEEMWGWFGDDHPSEAGGGMLRALSRGGEREGGGLGTAEGMVGGGGGGGRGHGSGEIEVTVSTLALTERLAKLSAGRALLDRVKGDTRSLASLVSSAVRGALSPSDDAGADAARVEAGESGGDGEAAATSTATAPVPAPTAPASSPAPAPSPTRAVRFTPGAPQEELQAPEAHDADGTATAAATAAVTAPPATGTHTAETATDAAATDTTARTEGTRAAAAETDMGDGYGHTPAPAGGQVRAGTFRQRVVEAKAELMELQRDVRRAVREGEEDGGGRGETRGKVAVLVARRTVLAAAALPDAKMMAVRLQEISEAQKSNHSNVNTAMREVERRARTAGGRVWALIRGRSRQGGPDEDGSGSGSGSGGGGDGGGGEGLNDDDDELGLDQGQQHSALASGASGGGGGGGGLVTPTVTAAADPDQAGALDDNDAPEWVFSRLESMRRRGSFLDGDALSAVRAFTDRAVVTEDSWRGGGGGGGGAISASFARLVRLASEEASRDREETDEALAVLRKAMQQHSAALAKLAVWMLQATEPTAAAISGGGGNGSSGSGSSGSSGSGGGDGSGASAGALPPPPQTGERATGLPVGPAAPGEDGGVMAVLELSRESDVLEGQVRRERFRAHRAADEEIHRTPGLYKEACALGNAMILQGHDYLSQALADADYDSSEASIMAEEASEWASRVAELADGGGLAARGHELRERISELRNSVLDLEDTVIDCEGEVRKKSRRETPAEELETLQVAAAAAEKAAEKAAAAVAAASAAAAAAA
ncbi:unnamed protein product, partial [Laminaria digitata]